MKAKYSEKAHKAFVKETKRLFREWGSIEAIRHIKVKLMKLKAGL